MTAFLCASLLTITLCFQLMAQDHTNNPPAAAKLPTTICDWNNMPVTQLTNGVRRAVFDGPTTSVDNLYCHITTLNPGQTSGEPRLHLHEEVIIIKEGTIEADWDGHTQTVGAGSVIFFAAHAVTRLRNVGTVPATYTVVYYFTPLTPKG